VSGAGVARVAIAALLLCGAGCERASAPAAADGAAAAAGDAAPLEPMGERGMAAIGREAPDFRLPRLGGGERSLADLRGRIVVIDFWATWCVPCQLNVPELNAFADAHRDDADVVLLGVATDVEGAETVAPWVEDKGVRYEVLLGDLDLATRYGIPGMPTTFFIDPRGRIADMHVGFIDRERLEDSLAHVRRGGS